MSDEVDCAVTAALLKDACRALGLEHLHLDLTGQYRNMVAGLGTLDEDLRAGDTEPLRTRRGSVRARLRTVTLTIRAHRRGGLVSSTDNFSALGAGFLTLHGDIGNLALVDSLLKSWEIPWMARAYGVPESAWLVKPIDGFGNANLAAIT